MFQAFWKYIDLKDLQTFSEIGIELNVLEGTEDARLHWS